MSEAQIWFPLFPDSRAEKESKFIALTDLGTNARTFFGTLFGQHRPILNSDFTPEQLIVISSLAAEAEASGRSYVTYEDYTSLGQSNTYLPEVNAGSSDPLYQVQTTLGQFNFEKMESGSYRVTDTYNFNPMFSTRDESQLVFLATIAFMMGFRAGDVGYKAITGTDKESFVNTGRGLKETAYNLMRTYGEAYGPREDEGHGRPVELYVRPPKVGND